MKPCDCKDQVDARSMNEQGIAMNDWHLTVRPATVEIEHKHYGMIKVPMHVMKIFAKWYMEDQDYECDCANGCASSKCDKR